MTKKKEDIRGQNVFTKRSCESLAMTEVSHEIALALPIEMKTFSDGE